jgi:TolB protein
MNRTLFRHAPVLALLATAVGACADQTEILAPLDEHPSFAEAGKPGKEGRIAFIIDAPAGNPLLYTMEADGSDIQPVRKAGYALNPAWSPDGNMLAYFSIPSVGDPEGAGLYVIRTKGGKPTRIFDGFITNPRWSPDGKRIAFSHTVTGSRSIAVINTDGTGFRQLTAGSDAFDMYPSWSADGERLAFWSSRPISEGRRVYGNIWVINADGSAMEPITDCEAAGVMCTVPSWSPVDDRIAFRLANGSLYAIGIVAASGGEIQTVLARTDHGGFGRSVNPAWSPDGTRFVFLSAMDGAGRLELHTARTDGTDVARATFMPEAKYEPAWAR